MKHFAEVIESNGIRNSRKVVMIGEAGANAKFLRIDGAGHDRRRLQPYATDFFRDVLRGESR